MGTQEIGESLIKSEDDILSCRQLIRSVAMAIGFGMTDVTRIVTAASELSRNINVHAGSNGIMRWKILQQLEKIGLQLEFEDFGKGIPDIEQAMTVGFTTSNSMGMGLSGVKRLMDEMTIKSEVGVGTIVTIAKWRKAT